MLWGATMMSNLGTLVQTVGAGWLMTSIATSPVQVALVAGSNTLPIMLFALLAGALADSYDRRRIMLVAQIFMFVVSIALTAAAWLDLLTPWSLLAFTFLIGCGMAVHNPSWQSSVRDLVPREDVPSAVLMNSMGFNLMRSVGPALGGFIVSIAGAALAFAVNAASYIFLIIALLAWRSPANEQRLPREPFLLAVSAGIRYVAMSPNLLRVLARTFLFGFGAVAILALLPLVARQQLQGTAITFGILLGSYGVGAIGGALGSLWLRARFDNEQIIRAGFLAVSLAVMVLAVSSSLLIDCLVLLLAGAGWLSSLSLFNVSVQLSTPRWVVGRALSIYQTCAFGGMAIGAWVWGAIAAEASLPAALMAAGLVLVGGAAVGLLVRLPQSGGDELDPLGRFREPELRLDLRQRSGPIMVMVDYEIDQADVPEFLRLMADRRRIRIRDGARQWALLRDLENPDIWTETYHVATWIEYVRHNERRTKADAEVSDRLAALHRGPTPLRVHRMIERQTVPLRDDMPLKDYTELP
ncbi:MFS transporter [Pseudohoeflea sp. DP4N28-3]|uniref:MFS transporter n=2 Tax=Pseudohoeflea coraliihabitans TaxID=2860393 RepID=A0ABS6WS59_9HYPH|nr:MFS transporter [Pseudohoeflea sp. DP4N28-3]